MANSLAKIEALEQIEKDIILCLQSAGQALQELSKEKPSQKNAENHTSQFLKSLNNIEMKLSDQINYLIQVSTSSAHEGSGYASAKVLQMAWHRMQNVRSRVRELEEKAQKHAKKQNTGPSPTPPSVMPPTATGGGSGPPSVSMN